MGNISSSPSDDNDHIPLKHIPKRYEPMQILGKGGCGVVLKCQDRKTKHTVAVKLSTSVLSLQNEISILKILNQSEFEDSFVKMLKAPWPGRYLVMELLDMNFRDYVKDNAPMKLKDIRTVIQQLAVAFEYLKANHIIHADFKLNNIMLVDHIRQPLKVKIIDFGLAVLDNKPLEMVVRQAYGYRAPEIILNLSFGAAIDIWSLGCVMSTMILGVSLFPGRAVYDQLYYMIDLLGPPPQRILNASTETSKYFKHTGQGWVLQTAVENLGKRMRDFREYNFNTLDQTKTMLLETDNTTEAEERGECIELLNSMLKWDDKQRITPQGILNHPFITKSFLKVRCYSNSCRRYQTMNREDSGNRPSTSTFMVQPATPELRSEQQDVSAEDSDLSAESTQREESFSESYKTFPKSNGLDERGQRRTTLLRRLLQSSRDIFFKN